MSESTNPVEVDRFRVALKFSLWTWALYWPGGGILMLTGGLDPISILVVLGSFATFVMLVLMGGLKTSSSRNVKQLLMERPLYFIAAVVLLAIMAPVIAPITSAALIIFATVYLAGIVFAGYRLLQVFRTQDKPLMQSGMDQAFIAMGLGILAAGLVFLDAWITLLGGEAVSGPPVTVAIANWVNLLYPPIVMLGTVGLREPLRKPRIRIVDEVDESPDAVKA